MSGPIVRKYGVPNWDEIFGKKSATKKAKPATGKTKSAKRAAKATAAKPKKKKK